MPLYQYRDKKTGFLTELIRSVERRDDVPANLARVTVPARLAIFGTSNDPRDPHSADAQVPKAYRQLEEQQHGREWLKEGGFTVDQVRQAWGF